jgi:cardiolipin synthase C
MAATGLSLHRRGAWRVLLLLSVVLTASCGSLPPQQNRTSSFALAPSSTTPLGQAIEPVAAKHPGLSGVVSIPGGRTAFASRVLLAREATGSIDIQTYIWRADATGSMLFNEMLQAAQRGVRVRLLLDDANTNRQIDAILAMLAQQPGIEVRLYNPFVSRGSRALGFLGDFGRLNHRMHNKTYIVDSQVAIVGGRNLADEYFEATEDTSMADLDAMAVGAVVPIVSRDFDEYWNSPSAYPVGAILAGVTPMTLEAFAQYVQDQLAGPSMAAYREALTDTPDVQRLLNGGLVSGGLALEWTTAQLLSDDPAKTLSPGTDSQLQMLPKLVAALGQPTRDLAMISPYFVPGDSGTAVLTGLVRRGVRVRILTNSLAANDVAATHAGYAKARVALLQGGVELYELKPTADRSERRVKDIASSSKSGLHAKTYAVDDDRVFVGSFNFDPRSTNLNTEIGMLFESPSLASRLSVFLDKVYPDLAYRVTLDAKGDLRWEDGKTVYDTEPETSWGQRAAVRFVSWLPVDWLL